MISHILVPAEVRHDRVRLRQPTGEDLWLSARFAGATTTGRLVLEVEADDVSRLAQEARG